MSIISLGGSNIRGISIEFGGNTTALTAALQDVNRQSRSLQGELRSVDRLLQLDPTNTELVAQQQRLLAEAVENSREKLNRLRAAQEQVNEQFARGEISQGQMRAFEREVARAEQELRRFEEQASDAGRAAATLGERIQNSSEILNNVGQQMFAVGAAATAGLGLAVKSAMDFEAQMDRVQAISGSTVAQFEQLRQAAIDLGGSTSFSASQVAQGMEMLAAAGMNANDILGAMPGVLSATSASGEDMALVAETMGNALNVFGLRASESTSVADVLAQVANMSSAGILDMSYTMKYAGPVAAQLGYSIEELGAAVIEMANAGIKGEQAGTTLRASLIRLVDPPKEAAEMMDKLGVVATDLNGKMLPMGDIIGQLETKMQGMTEAQKTAALAAIFGTEAVSGMMVLVNNGKTKFDEYTTALENSNGASQKAAHIMTDNLKGSLDQLSGAFESAAITIGTALAPAIQAVAKLLTTLVDKFNSLPTPVQNTVAIAAALAAVMALVGGPLLIVIGALPTMAAGFAVISGAAVALVPKLVALVMMGLGPVGIAIAAVIAIGVLLYKNLDAIQTKANEFVAGLDQTTDDFKAAVADKFSTMAEDAKEWGSQIIEGLITGIKDRGAALKANVTELINNNIPLVVRKLLRMSSPSQVMAEFGRNVAEGLAQGMAENADKVSEETQKLTQAIKQTAQAMATDLNNALTLTKAQLDLEAAAMTATATETEKLTLEMKKLLAEKEAAAAKVEILAAAHKTAKEKLGENNETTRQYSRELQLAQIELQKTETSIQKTNIAIGQQAEKAKEAAAAQVKALQDISDEIEVVEKKYRDDLVAAAEEYQEQVGQANERLIEDERRITREYEQELSNRADALSNFVSLFDAVRDRDITGDQLLANLRGQVDAFDSWQENIAELAARGVDEGLIEELRQMGPKAGPEIAALNTLTDEQLNEYVTLWRDKNQAAREEAVNQLQQQRVEMQQKLTEIRMAASEQLEQYRVEWEKKNAAIRKNAEEEMQRIEERFKSIAEAGTNYGVALVENFATGMQSRFDYLRAMVEEARQITAGLDPSVRHSPSLIDRVQSGIQTIFDSYKGLGNQLSGINFAGIISPGALSGLNSTNVSNSYGGNVINITVQDGEDMLRTLHRQGVRLP